MVLSNQSVTVMKDDTLKVTVLGCRGSVPVSGKQSLLYGGDGVLHGAADAGRDDHGDVILLVPG